MFVGRILKRHGVYVHCWLICGYDLFGRCTFMSGSSDGLQSAKAIAEASVSSDDTYGH
jgi:hypothetical protein